MAKFFAGKSLKSKKGIVSADEALAGKDVIAVYFSAHWCPPCRAFTPMLKSHYETIIKNGGKLALIFVSSDRSEEDMESYFVGHHGDWLAVQFSDNEIVSALKKNCGVTGIPKLVILNGDDGTPLKDNARNDVASMEPDECYDSWVLLCKK